MTTTMPTSNVTPRQVERLWNNYQSICTRGHIIVAAYERTPNATTLRALLQQVRDVDLAYSLWDRAHRACYGL